jgi:phosphatidylglycerol:prolipoprotein diacylglycerol transferase
MAPYLNIFGLTLQAYGLVILIALWVGLGLSAREARRLGIDSDHIYNLGLYVLLTTLLGARLTYVINNWSAYQGALLGALSPTPTALSWSGGLLIGGIVALIYWNRHQLPTWLTLDALALGAALALATARFGAFLDGSGFGEPTILPWGVFLWDELRHPVQLYEMVALVIILLILWWQRKQSPFNGHIFVLFITLYAGSRLFLETFRADAPLTTGGIRLVQPVSLVILLGAIGYLYYRRFSMTGNSLDQKEKIG